MKIKSDKYPKAEDIMFNYVLTSDNEDNYM